MVRYSLGIITVYAILSAALYLVINIKPAYTCTPLPTNLNNMTVFMASIVISLATPLIYAREKRWRVGSDWKPFLFTLYASIVIGSLIIDTTTALTLWTIPRLIPRACVSSPTIGVYGPIDGLVIAPLLGSLTGYIVIRPKSSKS